MGRIILVTGGARSGKSTFAEKLAREADGNVLYVATSIPFDDEMKERVRKHQQQRPAEWRTLEAYKNLDKAILKELSTEKSVLLDCITIMITNIMFDYINEKSLEWDSLDTEAINDMECFVKEEINKLADLKASFMGTLIAVTNELGMGIVPENKMSRVFRDIAGRMNQLLAAAADEVYLCVSGIPVKIK